MGDALWLLVEIDRHCDDRYALYQTRADALLAAGEFAAQYGEQYGEGLRSWRRINNDDGIWFDCGDDGPRCRILRMSLSGRDPQERPAVADRATKSIAELVRDFFAAADEHQTVVWRLAQPDGHRHMEEARRSFDRMEEARRALREAVGPGRSVRDANLPYRMPEVPRG